MVATVDSPFLLLQRRTGIPQAIAEVESLGVIPQFARSAYLFAYKYILACEERIDDGGTVSPYSTRSEPVKEARKWLRLGLDPTALSLFLGTEVRLPWRNNPVIIEPLPRSGPFRMVKLPDIVAADQQSLAHMHLGFIKAREGYLPQELSLMFLPDEMGIQRLVRFNGITVVNGRTLQYVAMSPTGMQALSIAVRDEQNRMGGVCIVDQSEFASGIMRAAGFASVLSTR